MPERRSRRLPPLAALRSGVGRYVLVKLKDGSEYVGRLAATDHLMNMVLEDCVEVKPGTSEPIVRHGRVLIRGSQVVLVSVNYEMLE